MPPKQKHTQQSLKKRVDKCVTCTANLAESLSKTNCDDCENWVCPAYPKLTDSEYELVNKIVEKISIRWVCPVCKASPQSASHHGASAAETTKNASTKYKPVPCIGKSESLANNHP